MSTDFESIRNPSRPFRAAWMSQYLGQDPLIKELNSVRGGAFVHPAPSKEIPDQPPKLGGLVQSHLHLPADPRWEFCHSMNAWNCDHCSSYVRAPDGAVLVLVDEVAVEARVGGGALAGTPLTGLA